MHNEIKGKVVAITGASSGMGEATALMLAAQSAKIVAGARRTDRLANLVARITQAGGEAVYMRTDVKQRIDLINLVELAIKQFGKLDVLINNAGIGPISLMEELRVEDWEEMIDINVKGVLYGIAASLPVFRQQGFGHIINIASTAGHRIVPTMAVYAGSKFAVRAISEGLRQEAGDKLRVTIISPGVVNTSFVESITDVGMKASIMETMGNIGISPDAIARAILYAMEQPAEVDINEIVIRPTAQG